MKTLLLASFLFFVSMSAIRADQFVLFDRIFTFEAKDAVPSKSHLFVKGEELSEETPKDWTSPVDYRNGIVHVRIEVIEKPKGDAPTTWSLCYIPNKGHYGCTNTPTYTKEGLYEKDVKMNEFWMNDSIGWTDGINHMSLVIKNATKGGKGHAHLEEDLSRYFPTKVRVTMVQVSKGSTYDASKVPELNNATRK